MNRIEILTVKATLERITGYEQEFASDCVTVKVPFKKRMSPPKIEKVAGALFYCSTGTPFAFNRDSVNRAEPKRPHGTLNLFRLCSNHCSPHGDIMAI